MTDLIEKVIQTSSIGSAPSGGGLLRPDQSDRFIDYMWDATVLGNLVRKVPMKANEIEVDRMAVGERIVRLATEAVDDGVNVGVAFSKVSMTTRKLRVDWELSTEALEDNLEGEAFEDHIARLMAARIGEDLEDLAINGDVDKTLDPLYKSFDGYSKLGKLNGHVLDAANKPLDRGIIHRAIQTLPRMYRAQRGDLRFFSGAGAMQNYLFAQQLLTDGNYIQTDARAAAGLAQNNNANGPAGWTIPAGFGFNITEVPKFREDLGTAGDQTELWFVNPKNLLWGVKREIKVYSEFVNKKDTIEYTVYTRVGCTVENEDAFVVVKNVKVTV